MSGNEEFVGETTFECLTDARGMLQSCHHVCHRGVVMDRPMKQERASCLYNRFLRQQDLTT
jgi:hypothetical protein